MSLAVLLLIPACSGGESNDTSSAPTTTRPLLVTFDATGRPYDRHLPDDNEMVREFLVDLHLPSGRLAISSGEVLPWLETNDPDARYLDLGPPGSYRVDVIWQQQVDDPTLRSPAGLVIRSSDEPVVEWRGFELAYGTDGGMGAFSTPEYHALNRGRSHEEKDLGAATDLLDEFMVSDEQLVIGDLDGHAGPDTVVFSNGFGDGGFPMSRGFDEAGQLAAVAIWHLIGPWRIAIPEGTPPPEVTAREREVAECVAGTRPVTAWGWCEPDDTAQPPAAQ